ncbi:MAG: prolipoprotein diacylglyceryl transferase [Cryomorphaceae bacterium]|nr:MAG: prolipoprotein diacylglyceryl transferase [Cryomorphaceae bacterium]
MVLNYIEWNVTPWIFEIGDFQLRWYGLLFAAGFMIGFYLLKRIFEHENVPLDWLDKVLWYVVIGTVVGARLGHVFFYDWDYYSQNLGEIVKVWRGGLASHGAAVGIILALYVYSRKVSGKSILWILDRVVITVAFAGVLIRLGNLMNHEIVGDVTNVPWAFIFTRADLYLPDGTPDLRPRHPSQIYEALSYLFSFGLLYWMYWKARGGQYLGRIFGSFLVLIFGFRFIIEFVKESQGGFESALGDALTTGQWLSIPFVLAGAYFIVQSGKKPLPQDSSIS